jgi:hypothetical protein
MSAIMSTALSTILIKPAELKDLLRSCGADDFIIMPAVLSMTPTKPAEL